MLKFKREKGTDGRVCYRADTSLGEVLVDRATKAGLHWQWTYSSDDALVSVESAERFKWTNRAFHDAQVFVDRLERNG